MNIDNDLDVLSSDYRKSLAMEDEHKIQALYDVKNKCLSALKSTEMNNVNRKVIKSFYARANYKLELVMKTMSKCIFFQENVCRLSGNESETFFLLSFSVVKSELFVHINHKKYLWTEHNFYLRQKDNEQFEMSIENEVMILKQNPKLSVLCNVLQVMKHIEPRVIIFQVDNVTLQYDNDSIDNKKITSFIVFVQGKKRRCQLNGITWDFDPYEFHIQELCKVVVPNYANNKKGNITMLLENKSFYEFGSFIETSKEENLNLVNCEIQTDNQENVFFECTSIDANTKKILRISLLRNDANFVLKVDNQQYSLDDIKEVCYNGDMLNIHTTKKSIISFKSKLTAKEFSNIIDKMMVDEQILFHSQNVQIKLDEWEKSRKSSFKIFKKNDKFYCQIGKFESEVELSDFVISNGKVEFPYYYSSQDSKVSLVIENKSEFNDFNRLINGKVNEKLVAEIREIEQKHSKHIKEDTYLSRIFKWIHEKIDWNTILYHLDYILPILLAFVSFFCPMSITLRMTINVIQLLILVVVKNKQHLVFKSKPMLK